MKKILIVEDDKRLLELFKEALGPLFSIAAASNISEANALTDTFDGMLLDLKLPDGEGIDIITPALKKNPFCIIIVVTAHGSVKKAVEAIQLGAIDFMEKPVDLVGLKKRFESNILKDKKTSQIISASPVIQHVQELCLKVAKTDLTVLLAGETGAGKEVFANFIHQKSSRKHLVSINCASLPKEIAESVLFGHVKGAFTGALGDKKGLVEAADKGTLFLDEIGDMPEYLQPNLLRFLDSGKFRKVGATQLEECDVRIIAATNQDLEKFVKEGRFRQDLFFRLNTFPIHIPPLRERPEDILPLANLRMAYMAEYLGRDLHMNNNARNLLKTCQFPGNVRELFNIIDRAAVLSKGTITENILNTLVRQKQAGSTTMAAYETGLFEELDVISKGHEQERIINSLKKTGGNKAAAARDLNVSYKTLLNKMKKLGIHLPKTG